jgi:hypothetical protein
MEDKGNEHECEFTLYVPKIGEADLKSLFLKNENCNVDSTDEYFTWRNR